MEGLFKVSPEDSYKTIGAALSAASLFVGNRRSRGEIAEARVLVAPGVYREKIAITEGGITIEGSGAALTRLVWDDCASRALPGGEPMGTFNSYTLYIGASDVWLRNLTVENDSGDPRVVGQAVALYADADRVFLSDCSLLSRQDTLCTGPLPKNPVPKGVNLTHPVAGLGDDEPGLPFRQYYRNCIIQGDVDFIFGSATAIFDHCEIRSLYRWGEGGYVAAPSTYPDQDTGFIFTHCSLTYQGGAPADGPIYLCRPWRPTARCAFLNCELGAHIDPAGWDDWEKPESHELGLFLERGSRGPGAAVGTRPSWVKVDSLDECAAAEGVAAEIAALAAKTGARG